jgi:hypothetical protein
MGWVALCHLNPRSAILTDGKRVTSRLQSVTLQSVNLDHQ